MSDPLETTDLAYRKNKKRVTSQFRFDSCLVSTTPTKGWGVTVAIKGVPAEVNGATPLAVFNALETRLKANGIEGFDPVDVWCNLNLRWMSELNRRHHKISLPKFLSFITAVEPARFESSTQIHHPPSEWVHLNRAALEIYLCREDYRWDAFRGVAQLTLDALDPVKCPILGSAGLHASYRVHIAEMANNPLYTRKEARAWLVTTLNALSDTPYEGSPLWVR